MNDVGLAKLKVSIADELNRLEVRMATRRSLNSVSTNMGQWAESFSKHVEEIVPALTSPSPTIQLLHMEAEKSLATRDRTLAALRSRTQLYERWFESLEDR